MNSRELFLFLAMTFGSLLPSCSTYEIPEKEAARLQILVYQNQIKEVNLEELFKDHKFPKLKDYFFYVLYHLEKQPGNYMVNKQEMIDYFEKNGFESSIPLDDLEKIVREHNYLKIYTGGFSKRISGTKGQLSLCASEDICFYSSEIKKKKGHHKLNLVLGSLNIEFNFPLNLVYGAKPEVKAIEIYDQGTNMMFYCQCFWQGEMKKTRRFYHLKDGSSSEQEGWGEDYYLVQAK